MTRRLLNLLTALSLLLCVVVAALWVRSHRRYGEALVWCDHDPRPNPHGRDFPVWHVYKLCSFRGRLGVERRVYTDKGFLEGGVYRRDPLYIPRYGPPPWAGHGFSVYSGWRDDLALGSTGVIGSETEIDGATVPHWAALLAFAIPATWGVVGATLRRRRAGRRGFPVETDGGRSGEGQ
jgi:hypothetical protein